MIQDLPRSAATVVRGDHGRRPKLRDVDVAIRSIIRGELYRMVQWPEYAFSEAVVPPNFLSCVMVRNAAVLLYQGQARRASSWTTCSPSTPFNGVHEVVQCTTVPCCWRMFLRTLCEQQAAAASTQRLDCVPAPDLSHVARVFLLVE